MRICHTLLTLAFFALPVAAQADTITYSIKAYMNTDPTQAITLTGTTTIDVNNINPSVLSITLNFSNGTTLTGIGSLGQDHGHNLYVGAANDLFSFTDDLHNFTAAGGNFNLQDKSGNYVGSVSNGMVASVVATPEPSSLILLATGLLGIIGLGSGISLTSKNKPAYLAT